MASRTTVSRTGSKTASRKAAVKAEGRGRLAASKKEVKTRPVSRITKRAVARRPSPKPGKAAPARPAKSQGDARPAKSAAGKLVKLVKKLLPAKAPAVVAPKVKPVVNKVPSKAPAIAEPKVKPVAVPKPADSQSAVPKPVIPPDRSIRHKSKPLTREFLLELANSIRTVILPLVREARGREITGAVVSGDATFEVDRVAEKALLTFLKNARLPVAYYSEDSGYTTFTNAQPQNLLLIDPIDGTRAAKSGFESCVISIATTRVIERPCVFDLDNALIVEIVGDRVFYAERGKGARINQGEHVRRPKLSKNTTLELLSWSMTVPARPAELIFPTAARLIDLSSLKGGFFACNSSSYSITRLLTNQLDACVDFANRFMRDIPSLVKDHFINAGRGTVIGAEPYDLAAAVLIAQEAGCTITDAYGKGFDDVLLLDNSVENQRSVIAAGNAELHEKLLRFFDMRIQQWEQLLRRRAERAAAARAASS